MNKQNLEMAEEMISTVTNKCGASGLIAAINNVFCHGKGFIEAGVDLYNIDPEDKLLGEWFDCIEKMGKIAKKLEK